MKLLHSIIGAGGSMGGGGSVSGTEEPDTLKSATHMRTLDLLGEGEMEGFFYLDSNKVWQPCNNGGTEEETNHNICKAVYLDRVPICNTDGSYNFVKPVFAYRYGTPDQSALSDYPTSENTHAVGVHLTKVGVPPIRSLQQGLSEVLVNIQCNQFMRRYADSADVVGTAVSYKVVITLDGAPKIYVFTLQGKCSSFYIRTHSIMLPSGYTNATISVQRLTDDSDTSLLIDDIYWESYVEHVGGTMRYPNSAMFQLAINSESFSSVPNRSFRMRLRRIKVPSNYDPETREYTGIWDGTFKVAWTNNPAWVYYDLLTNDRFGLGAYFSSSGVDKWGLYTVAQYCDQMVPDGFGGMEPRFRCNCYIQTLNEAYDFLRQFVSIFRGMSYWAGDTLMVLQDRDGQSPVQVYSPANVIEGKFDYQTTPVKGRHTVALVSYLDPDDHYERKIEYVEADAESIRKYGVRELEIQAFGCTSRGQANRHGRWALMTELYETEMVSFKVGQDSALIRPGQIIAIADPLRAGVRWGGRLMASTTTSVTLDSPVSLIEGHTYKLTVINPSSDMKSGPLESGADYLADHLTELEVVAATTGDVTTLTIPPVTYPMQVGTMWMLEEPGVLQSQQFRVLNITEEKNGQYSITALVYFQNKYLAVEQGMSLDRPPISIGQVLGSIRPPSNVTVLDEVEVRPEGVTRKITAAWVASPDTTVTGYEVEYRYGFNNWTFAGKTDSLALTFVVRAPASYEVRVRAFNNFGKYSVWVTKDHSVTPGFINDAGIANLHLTAHGIELTDFSGKDPEFRWDLQLTQYGFVGPKHPTLQYYVIQIRDALTDNLLRQEAVDGASYVYTLEKNAADNDGIPQRRFKFVVTASFIDGTFSSAAQMEVNNPAPFICPFPPTIDTDILRINSRDSRLLISYTKPTDLDFEGVMVFVSTNENFDITDVKNPMTGELMPAATIPYDFETGEGMLAYKGADSLIQVDLALNTTYRVIVAAYDSFGTSDLYFCGPATVVIGAVFEVDTTPPDVPTGLVLTTLLRQNEDGSQSTEITAKWNANQEDDLLNYQLYIREISGTPEFTDGVLTGFGGYAQIHEATYFVVPARLPNSGYIADGNGKVSHTFTGLLPNVWYEVRLAASDTSDNLSGYTAETDNAFIQSAKDTVPPADPTAVSLTAGFRTVLVEWTPPADADLSHCVLEWNRNNGAWEVLDNVSGISYIHVLTTATGTEQNYYRVKAVDTSGNSSGYAYPSPAYVTTALLQTSDISLKAITTSLLNDKAITGTQLADGAVNTIAIANAAVSGTKIAAGTITAGNIMAGTITGDRIAANAITAGLISAGAIVASKMTLENQDSILADPGFYDLAGSWGITPTAYVYGKDATLTSQLARRMLTIGYQSVSGDSYGSLVPIEHGATYRVRLRLYMSSDAAGKFCPVIHVPSQAWYGPYTSDNPFGDGVTGINLSTTSLTKGSWITLTGTFTHAGVGAAAIQPRTRWELTAGYVEFAWEVVRAGTADLIVDGAITTDKLYAGAVTAAKIAAGTITADRFSASLAFVSDLQITSGGKIRLGAATAIMTGAGGYMDASSFRVGNPAGAYLYYNGGTGVMTIRGDLQSANYVAGTTGWKLSNDGSMDLTSLSVGVAPGSIGTTELANNAVTDAKIGTGAVTSGKIPNGTIASNHLVTSSAVITGAAQIANAIIGTAHVGSISVTKISASNLSSLSAVIGLLRTATSGARLEIESNCIRVYDSSNVLRVRMGVW